MLSKDELDRRFTYHAPKDKQPERYTQLRAEVRALAANIDELVPDSREKPVALTSLETALFWANAAIARNE